MGILETEIVELRKMAKDVLEGKLKPEHAAVQLGIYNQVAKREQMIITSMASFKDGKKRWAKLVNKNLISDQGAIDTAEEPNEKVVCSEKGGKLISNDECLDYSGDHRHTDACQGCDNFSRVRKLLLNNR